LKNPVTQKYKARIYTFNVGQGDSIILEFENGEIWMIDAFFWGQKKYSFFENWMNSKYRNPRINRLIISHFHNDHIRSALKIIKYFNPSEVIVPSSLVHKTSIVRNLLVGIPHNNTLRTLSKIEKINYNGLEISILPTSCLPSNKCRKSKDPNENELIVTVEANNKIVLLVGDTPGHILNDLNNCFTVNNKEIYYKVSHHCSRTGIGQLFLQNFKPYYAVTSCGIKNRYGHPHSPPQDEIIKFCNGNNGRYFRTYEKKEPIMWEI
jgi:competence protein ComEC